MTSPSMLREPDHDAVVGREVLPDVLEERHRLREELVLVLPRVAVQVVKGAHVFEIRSESDR